MSEEKRAVKPELPAGLVFFEAQEKPRQYVIFDKAVIKGRQEMDVFTTSALRLAYPFLDEEQCEIRFEDGRWLYKNLSENVFTFVAGKLLPCGEECELKDNAVIRLSNDRMLTAVFLETFASSTDWQMINLDDGRHSVVIENKAPGQENSGLSLEYENGRWLLKDTSVSNLRLNGTPVSWSTPLQFDDCLQTGSTRFIFEGSGLLYGMHTVQGGLDIAIDERTVINSMKKTTLLKDINLSIEPGNMVMILGGSGAGKSTFVNAVTGYEKAKATITEGGVDYYKQYEQVKHRITRRTFAFPRTCRTRRKSAGSAWRWKPSASPAGRARWSASFPADRKKGCPSVRSSLPARTSSSWTSRIPAWTESWPAS